MYACESERCVTMTDIIDFPAQTTVVSDRTLTLNLILRGGQAISVRSCEILGQNFRNRVSFQGVNEINDVLVTSLALALRKSLASVPDDGPHVLALPEFIVEVPGLMLCGAHVMVMKARNGLRNAIVRFREFMGSVNEAFHHDLGFQGTDPSHTERLAASVFNDICLPMLNLCRDMEFARESGTVKVPAELIAKAQEFEFQAELLKRFIFNAGSGHSDPTSAHLGVPVQQMLR